MFTRNAGIGLRAYIMAWTRPQRFGALGLPSRSVLMYGKTGRYI